MIKSKQTKQDTIKNIVYDAFMKSPIPLTVTTLKDGTLVAINEVGTKYMDRKHEDIIGRNATELGVVTKERRRLYVDEIKKNGFVRNIPSWIKVNGIRIPVLYTSFLFKRGKADLLLSFLYSMNNPVRNKENAQNDLFNTIALLDHKYIKGKIKQYKLTSRQQEVALLSLQGYSNLEISETLYISPHTVKDHLKEIFHVIGVRSRSELFPKLLNLR